MDYTKLTSPCGRDCFNCPLYRAKDNERFKNIIARKLGIPVNKAYCCSCREESGVIRFLNQTESCKIWQCTIEKNINFCYECEDFPCNLLHPLADKATELAHNTKVFNLCLIKKMGVDEWAREKAKEVYNTYFNGNLEELLLHHKSEVAVNK